MNQNIAVLAGRTVDFSVLSNQQQQAVVNFVEDLTREKGLNQPMQKKTLHLADLFDMVKIDLPKDYKFDREEANER